MEPRSEGPDRAQVEQVAAVFERLAAHAHQPLGRVDMGETRVRHDRGCGTVAWHAGWYLVGSTGIEGGSAGPHGDKTYRWTGRSRTTRLLCGCAGGGEVAFEDGGALMAHARGFTGHDDARGATDALAAFACAHDAWWGNHYGARLFCDERALGGAELGAPI